MRKGVGRQKKLNCTLKSTLVTCVCNILIFNFYVPNTSFIHKLLGKHEENFHQ